MDASSCPGKIDGEEGARAMPFDAPFKLGPFEVDSEGRLSPGDPPASPAFLFRWHGRVVRSRLAQADDSAGRLSLQVMMGRVPSTASARDETLRPRSFAFLHWLARAVPPGWRVHLAPDHRMWLETEAGIALPITAADLITTITCLALDLAAYLDLLDENAFSG